MPEYYGYKAPEQVNLGKSIANVAELFVKAEEQRAAKRDEEQKSLDAAKKKINEIEQSSNPSVGGLVNNGVENARNYIVNLEKLRKSGQITGAEFNRSMTNINDSWDNFAFATKNMNERLAENLARQESADGTTPPPASSVEMKRAQIQSDILNTKNKSIIVGDDGNMYMVDKANPDKPISLRALGNLDNIVHNRLDINTMVQNGVANFGDFTVEKGTTTESGARTQGDLYKAAKYDLINSIVDKKNPAAIVSILMDNMGSDYDQYYNNTEKNELLDEAVARQEAIYGYKMDEEQKKSFKDDYMKNNMIEYKLDDNGVYQPVVNADMIKKAENYIDQTIEMQVGRTVTQDEPFKPSNPSGPNGGTSEITTNDVDLVVKVMNAWANKDWNAIRSATNNRYYFKWEGEGEKAGLSVYDEDPDVYKKEKAEYDKLSRAEKIYAEKPTKPKPLRVGLRSVKQLSDQFFGTTEQDKKKWEYAVDQIRKGNSSSGNTGGGGNSGAGDIIMNQ